MQAAFQHEAVAHIGGEDPPLLRAQQSRKDRDPARLQGAADVLGQGHQRRGQDIGEHQVIGRGGAYARIAKAVGVKKPC